MPKRAPETGVPKTEAKPALIPQMTSRRRSSSRSFRMSAKRLVSEAPICAAGPSFPTEPPNASVSTVAASLTGAMSQSMRPDRWCTAAMTASVPWPRASGAKRRMSQTHAGRASGRSQNGANAPRVSHRTTGAEWASTQRKARVPSPTQTPAPAPRTALLISTFKWAALARPRAEDRPFEGADKEGGMLGVPPALVGEARRLRLGAVAAEPGEEPEEAVEHRVGEARVMPSSRHPGGGFLHGLERRVRGDLRSLVVHVVDVERRVRVDVEQARGRATELVRVPGGHQREPAGAQRQGLAIPGLDVSDAAHQHQVLVGRVPVPGDGAAGGDPGKDHRGPVPRIAALNRARPAGREPRDRRELDLGNVPGDRLAAGRLSPNGAGQGDEEVHREYSVARAPWCIHDPSFGTFRGRNVTMGSVEGRATCLDSEHWWTGFDGSSCYSSACGRSGW